MKSTAVADDLAKKVRQIPSSQKSAFTSTKKRNQKHEPQKIHLLQGSRKTEKYHEKQSILPSTKSKTNQTEEPKKLRWWQCFKNRSQVSPSPEEQHNFEKRRPSISHHRTTDIKQTTKAAALSNWKIEKSPWVNQLATQVLGTENHLVTQKQSIINQATKKGNEKKVSKKPRWWQRFKNRSKVAPAPEDQHCTEKRHPTNSIYHPREAKGTAPVSTMQNPRQQRFRISGGYNIPNADGPQEQQSQEKKCSTAPRQSTALVKDKASMAPVKHPRQQFRNLGGSAIGCQMASAPKDNQYPEKKCIFIPNQQSAGKVRETAPMAPAKPPRQQHYKTSGGTNIQVASASKQQQWPEKNSPSVSRQHNMVESKASASVPTTKPIRQQQFKNPGFPNPAMYCYMNSCLQSLLTLLNFVRDIARQEPVWGNIPEAGLLKSFLNISKFHFSPDAYQKSCLLSAFKCEVALRNPEFTDLRQKDAHEFLMAVLDQMRRLGKLLHRKAGRLGKVYSCPVDDHMVFKMKNNRTCKTCGAKSERTESFTSLSLDLLPRGTVKQLLDNYRSETEVEYKCDCGATTSVQNSTFATLPKVLILQLKRFRFTSAFQVTKVHDDIVLLRELQVTSRQGVGRYRLVSCISHMGDSARSGHYICDGVDPDVRQVDPTDRWFTYNDDVVSETCGPFVFKLREKYAYILFYQRQD
ncbi:ubiquitin carboxyl-terminal hydrolase 37-like isoform X2 [Cynoglossus semilaevis]|uniref:ubiquitin carboxyl-terminal hydrolase 37-like isoform X2 n=1 Tax=Cynoglossus semilaevis TaxID=244447 RepID=UPI0007DC836C|nr:ubiquitin carboxyl-terminal hydrolase 37-like isoform X2 [Cynoglossus semilaevis]